MTIMRADLTKKEQVLSANLSSKQQLSASLSSKQQLNAAMQNVVIVYRASNIKTISLDGSPIEPDNKGNVNIDIGLDKIKQRITDLESTSPVVISFEESDFRRN